jgi:phosphoesterase RecJ-like protein
MKQTFSYDRNNLQEAKQGLAKLLSSSRKIIVISHRNPDDDAVGSMLSAAEHIKEHYPGLEVGTAIEGENSGRWWYLEAAKNIEWVSDMASKVAEYDTVVFTDHSELRMFSKDGELLTRTVDKKTSIALDHHTSEPYDFDITIRDPFYPAATSLIYDLFYREEIDNLSKEVAMQLLTGILGDTGLLRYVHGEDPKVLVDVMSSVAKLLLVSGKDMQFFDLVMNSMKPEEMEIISALVKTTNYMELDDVPSFSYTHVPEKLFDKHPRDIVESAAAKFKRMFIRRIEHYPWGILVIPKADGNFKLDFRSTPQAPDILSFAKQFGGGGHPNAGGAVYSSVNEHRTAEDVAKFVAEVIRAKVSTQ